MAGPPDPPLLRAVDVRKAYGHVHALDGVDFEARAGEVTALIGDNGAGKSSLVRILSGTDRPDSGRLLLDGRPVRLTGPAQARRLGIETVYQDLALAPELDVTANLFIGREILRRPPLGWFGVLDTPAMRARAGEALVQLGSFIHDMHAPVAALSGGQRQAVAVSRALTWAGRVALLDEPAAALGVVQSAQVLDLIRRIRDTGLAVVLISHSMPDVLAVADRVEVLRLGRRVARFSRDEATTERLVAAMTGAPEPAGLGEPVGTAS